MIWIGVVVAVVFVAWLFWSLQNPGVDSEYLGGYPEYDDWEEMEEKEKEKKDA